MDSRICAFVRHLGYSRISDAQRHRYPVLLLHGPSPPGPLLLNGFLDLPVLLLQANLDEAESKLTCVGGSQQWQQPGGQSTSEAARRKNAEEEGAVVRRGEEEEEEEGVLWSELRRMMHEDDEAEAARARRRAERRADAGRAPSDDGPQAALRSLPLMHGVDCAEGGGQLVASCPLLQHANHLFDEERSDRGCSTGLHGGRAQLLGMAVQRMAAMRDQNGRMAALLRRLDRESSLLARMDALHRENSSLNAKYVAMQVSVWKGGKGGYRAEGVAMQQGKHSLQRLPGIEQHGGGSCRVCTPAVVRTMLLPPHADCPQAERAGLAVVIRGEHPAHCHDHGPAAGRSGLEGHAAEWSSLVGHVAGRSMSSLVGPACRVDAPSLA